MRSLRVSLSCTVELSLNDITYAYHYDYDLQENLQTIVDGKVTKKLHSFFSRVSRQSNTIAPSELLSSLGKL